MTSITTPIIQPTKLLTFGPSDRRWVPVPPDHQIGGSAVSSPVPPPMVIATWNVWEDDRFTEYRYPYLLRNLFDGSSLCLDVLTLQEVTPEFFDLILEHKAVQDEWLVTDLEHQLDICSNPYGTVILIRKSLVQGYFCAAGFHEFENTHMQRGLNYIELCSGSSRRPILRIGTSHFESHPEDLRKRQKQFVVSADILSSRTSFLYQSSETVEFTANDTDSVPAILTGDCNICSYDELAPLLTRSPAFADALLAALPIQSKDSPFTSYPTFDITITNRRMFGKQKTTGPRRLDYIFVQGFHVTQGESEAGLMGNGPVCEEKEAEDNEGRDGRVYASDHLGVWVRVRLPTAR